MLYLLSVYVILGIGIDDVHIYLDSYKQAHYLPTERDQFTSAYKRAR